MYIQIDLRMNSSFAVPLLSGCAVSGTFQQKSHILAETPTSGRLNLLVPVERFTEQDLWPRDSIGKLVDAMRPRP